MALEIGASNFGSGNFWTAGITQPGGVETTYTRDRDTRTVRKVFDASTLTTPAIGSTQPGTGFVVDTVQVVEQPAGNGEVLYEVTVNMARPAQGQTPGQPVKTFQCIAGTEQAPIESHRNFKTQYPGFSQSIVDAAGGAVIEGLAPTGSAFAIFANIGDETNPVTGGFREFGIDAQNNLRGVTDYLAPALTYRITYSTSSPPTSIANVGKRMSTPPPNAPSLPPGGNWLFAALQWELRNGNYDVSEEYIASGPLGWNPYIYESTATT